MDKDEIGAAMCAPGPQGLLNGGAFVARPIIVPLSWGLSPASRTDGCTGVGGGDCAGNISTIAQSGDFFARPYGSGVM